MKLSLTSLLLIGMFCFVPLTMTGCGGGDDATVIEAPEDPNAGLFTEDEEDEYEKAMMEAASGGDE